MADWVNKGSYADLSGLLPGDKVSALVPTSQHAGNQVWANNAMSGPGGASGDLGNDLNQAVVVKAPTVETQDSFPPGDDGKPQASKHTDYTRPGPPGWKATTVPTVVRDQ